MMKLLEVGAVTQVDEEMRCIQWHSDKEYAESPLLPFVLDIGHGRSILPCVIKGVVRE